MSTARGGDIGGSTQLPPEGRYGRSADDRADRKLKIIGSVLGALFIAMIAWFGYDYISGEKALSAQVVTFDAVSDREVVLELDVTKDVAVAGSCTVRALDEGHGEVGRKDVRFERDAAVSELRVSLRTTAKATSAELVGCDVR